jgi:hypothetical protein
MTDHRAEGTVDPPEHNLRRAQGTTTKREAKLEDPNLPHQAKSRRELRREEEREGEREGERGDSASSE